MRVKHLGFTLIELLVVLAILGLIVGLVGPQVMKQLAGVKAETARLQIADLGAGLDLFFLDVGRYPTSSEGLQALVEAPPDIAQWHGPYLTKSSIPDDPWNRPYRYESPGKHAPYDLFSYGADGQPGGENDDADIVSWE